MRPKEIITVLDSIKNQTIYPNQIIVVDASTNSNTIKAIENYSMNNLDFYYVDETYRGSAKQRNYGIDKIKNDIDYVLFLDDDVVLLENYCENILTTYNLNPDALGVSGLIIEEKNWLFKGSSHKPKIDEYFYDGWVTKESLRGIIRKLLKLYPNVPPGIMPDFSHGNNLFPPSDKIYNNELLMSGVCSYKYKIIKQYKFDNFFHGYSLYEDIALSLRISKIGKMYINTKAKLYHYHAESGRPNKFNYGKMVVRNGWYVWRLKFPYPSFKAKIKWHLTTLLLLFLRFLNVFTTRKRQEAFTESIGRMVAYLQLFYNKPMIERS